MILYGSGKIIGVYLRHCSCWIQLWQWCWWMPSCPGSCSRIFIIILPMLYILFISYYSERRLNSFFPDLPGKRKQIFSCQKKIHGCLWGNKENSWNNFPFRHKDCESIPVLLQISHKNMPGYGSGSAFIFPPESGSAFNMRIRIQEWKIWKKRKNARQMEEKCYFIVKY